MEHTVDSIPPVEGFTLKDTWTSSGSYTAILDRDVHPERILLGLQELHERDNVIHLDLSAYPTEAVDNDHSELSKMLLPFALKEDIISITLPDQWIHRVKGFCKGIFVDTIRGLTGPYVNIMGKNVMVKDAVDHQDVINKFTDHSKDADGTLLQTMYQVVKNIKSMPDVPQILGNMVVNAAMHVRRLRKRASRQKKRVQRKERESSVESDPEDKSDKENDSEEDDQLSGSTSSMSNANPIQMKNSPNNDKPCYVCKKRFVYPGKAKRLDECWLQYPLHCHSCAEFNFHKRNQTCDLNGKYAVVTGGRIKIGYHIVLKLLRDGCHVITTTRFPLDAARRFQEEEDFKDFKSRLKIYPLELKNVNGIYDFMKYVEQTFPHLDILINNAAQTIRRPKVFFQHMLSHELTPIDELNPDTLQLLGTTDKLDYGVGSVLTNKELSSDAHDAPVIENDEDDLETHNCPNRKRKLSLSDETCNQYTPKIQKGTHVSNPPISFESEEHHDPSSKPRISKSDEDPHGLDDFDSSSIDVLDTSCVSGSKCDTTSKPKIEKSLSSAPVAVLSHFPAGMLDADGQQIDLRPQNSWILDMEQVPLKELLEVLTINTIAPFILNQRLKLWMDKSPNARKFIVNVSAMEGQFNRRTKNQFHPHTNMAKASLNMMTRTAAIGYRDTGVYMTAVDTGWVTDERPYHQVRHEENKGFVLPLDCVDGAARVYDPIVTGLKRENEPHYAVFLKDYRPYSW